MLFFKMTFAVKTLNPSLPASKYRQIDQSAKSEPVFESAPAEFRTSVAAPDPLGSETVPHSHGACTIAIFAQMSSLRFL